MLGLDFHSWTFKRCLIFFSEGFCKNLAAKKSKLELDAQFQKTQVIHQNTDMISTDGSKNLNEEKLHTSKSNPLSLFLTNTAEHK